MVVAHWTKGRCPQMSRTERGVAPADRRGSAPGGVASLCRYCGQEARRVLWFLDRSPQVGRIRLSDRRRARQSQWSAVRALSGAFLRVVLELRRGCYVDSCVFKVVSRARGVGPSALEQERPRGRSI